MEETRTFASGWIAVTLAPVARLVINRPEVCNAVTREMWSSMIDACELLGTSPEVRVVVISGAGRHFCAGADISEFESVYATDESAEQYNAIYRTAETAVRDLPMPVIAETRGACFGGGLGLALSADMRFADPSVRLAVTASKLGVAYSAEDSARIMEKIGPARSKDLLFSARTIEADEALSWGLIDRLFPSDQFSSEVLAYAETLASRSRASLRAIKKIINGLTGPDPALCDSLRPTYSSLFRGEDLAEGRRAFLEKREPVFT